MQESHFDELCVLQQIAVSKATNMTQQFGIVVILLDLY